MTTFTDRIIKELDELSIKTDKLANFILTDTFDALAPIEQTDLKEQFKHMKEYKTVLSRRASRICGN